MEYSYRPQGICASRIDFAIDDEGKLRNVTIIGGCDGNSNALRKVLEGMVANKVATLFDGNDCGGKGTSCADQLSKAIKLALENK